jgi:hypothetical protein
MTQMKALTMLATYTLHHGLTDEQKGMMSTEALRALTRKSVAQRMEIWEKLLNRLPGLIEENEKRGVI